MITFPVRPYPIDQDGRPLKPGTPRRAVACHCERPLVDVQTDTAFGAVIYPRVRSTLPGRPGQL